LREIPRLLANLALHREGRSIADIDPTAGQCPFAIGALPHHQYLVAVEDSAAHVDFGCRVAFVALPQVLELAGRDIELGCQDLGHQSLQLLEALTVEWVVSEGQTILCNGLDLASPLENVHRLLISA